jgi:iron complex outermembrane receptor protein
MSEISLWRVSPNMRRRRDAIAAATLFLTVGAGSATAVPATAESTSATSSDPATPDSLQTVVVIATRAPQSSFDLPVSVDRIDAHLIRDGQLQVNLSESLIQVPGVAIQSRQNYAQDLQLSVRGFGARSSFGVRGVRLYADGIPGTMPDGQGQFSHFDLGSAGHIEVLRGPFSALYGNSSGGVIAIFTADAAPGFQIDADAEGGDLGTHRYALMVGGTAGASNYVLDAAHFETEGFRDHSRAERNNLNSKVRISLDDVSKLTLVANAVETPSIQDPLGLTRAQLEAEPRQAGTNAILYDTRKSLSQEQIGVAYERELAARDELSATVYGGHRSTTQFQAIPQSSESAPQHPGGVIDLGRNYRGIDVHVTDHRTAAGTQLQLTAGVSYDDLDEQRRGFLNFIGTDLGVQGALRRSETNHVHDLDEYLQLQWDPSERWSASTGVRHSVVNVSSHNHLVSSGGTALSGVRYAATNPVAGLTYHAAPGVNLYASYGRGFETPTLNDLAYRSTDGRVPGLNLALIPAKSDHYELGIKALGAHLRADLAAFDVQTHDELAVLANAAGRSVFQNIGATERRGAELGMNASLNGGFSARLAYTYLRAVVTQPYKTCVGLPCTPAVTQAGSRLPALPANSVYAGLSWAYPRAGFSATVEVQSRAQIFVDDRNSDVAAGYTIANLSFGFEQSVNGWRFTEFARIDNLTGRQYVGSVIVNDSNSRFFEPAPGRGAFLMFTATRHQPASEAASR